MVLVVEHAVLIQIFKQQLGVDVLQRCVLLAEGQNQIEDAVIVDILERTLENTGAGKIDAADVHLGSRVVCPNLEILDQLGALCRTVRLPQLPAMNSVIRREIRKITKHRH